ncbi:hypothetical protein HWV62_16716 [Athelia sp. TMB]|nr:hypothetical protein HWV62_16716 [Athelia sp. TMB]
MCNFFARAGISVWDKTLHQRQAAFVLITALLAPEWILAWAVRQLLVARRLAKRLEKARVQREGMDNRGAGDAEGKALEGVPLGTIYRWALRPLIDARRVLELKKADDGLNSAATLGRSSGPSNKPEDNQLEMVRDIANDGEVWTTQQALFAIMGGWYSYTKDGRPRHPLSPEMVVQLVKRGLITSPRIEELANQSKGDALSKCVAIGQTLWFVVQCIARLITHLPLASLEVMTLAYTVITVAMYIVWWNKPLNVTCAIRITEEVVRDENPRKKTMWLWLGSHVMGMQDELVDLTRLSRVPSCWAGNPELEEVLYANSIAIVVAIAFGAVHCIAWFAFQSLQEQQVWRVCAITITAVPVILTWVFWMAIFVAAWKKAYILHIILPPYVLLAFIYSVSRCILIVIAFTSLGDLPPAAYQTVDWTTFAPHV